MVVMPNHIHFIIENIEFYFGRADLRIFCPNDSIFQTEKRVFWKY